MKPEEWNTLLKVIEGKQVSPLPVAFIIDSPWLPGWCGHTILDYYGDENLWMECNLEAIQTFPDITFLPGFWSEFGMCTEPSAFGSKTIWYEQELPFAEKVVEGPEGMASLEKPDVEHDGLLPFMLGRLKRRREQIEEEGHVLKFAVARGPFNIASFLRGSTEFLMALKMHPDEARAMLDVITDFLVDWLRLQREAIPTIEGIFLLDDVVGFVGEEDFTEFAKPCLRRAFNAFDTEIGFFHNDSKGTVCAPHLSDIGVNLFNFSHEHSLGQMRELAGEEVTLLGNLPPRDVLGSGGPEDVQEGVSKMCEDMPDLTHLIPSCGGGIPPGVPTENIRAFLEASREITHD